jgi:hypothetical protein
MGALKKKRRRRLAISLGRSEKQNRSECVMVIYQLLDQDPGGIIKEADSLVRELDKVIITISV